MTPDEQAAEVARLKALMASPTYYVMFREMRDPTRIGAVLLDHYRWIIALEKGGKVFASGPLTRQEGGPGVGMTIFRADGFAEAEALAAGDPFVTSGAVGFRVDRWQINEGRISLSFDLSDQRGGIV